MNFVWNFLSVILAPKELIIPRIRRAMKNGTVNILRVSDYAR